MVSPCLSGGPRFPGTHRGVEAGDGGVTYVDDGVVGEGSQALVQRLVHFLCVPLEELATA